MSESPHRPQSDSVRDFIRAWWNQPGLRLQLVFIAMLMFLVQRNGIVRLVVTLVVAGSALVIVGIWKYRKHGSGAFDRR